MASKPEPTSRELQDLRRALAERDQSLAERDQKLTELNRTIETLRRMIEQQRRQLDQLILAASRKKGEPIDPKQGLFDKLLVEVMEEAETAREEADHRQEPEPPPPAAPAGNDTQRSRYRKPHPGRRVIPEHYERNVIVLDIPEQDKIDPITGLPLTVIRVERTEKIEVVPARLRVNVYERPIYGLPNRDGVVVAELPLFPIDKCMADNGFLADVAVKRFVDHLPYYRQAEASVRDGLPFHRNEFDEWMLILGDEVLVPLHEALIADVLARDYVGFDDSGIALQIKGLGKLHPARLWICRAGTGPPHLFFRFSLTKEKDEPVALLRGFQGYAQADAAGGHDKVMKTDGIVEVGCWAHATRRFKQAVVYHPVETVGILNWIKHLYQVEEQTRDLPHPQRHAVRLASSKPVVDSLFVTFEQIRAKLLPKSLLGEAVNYCLNQRAALQRYLQDGRLMIDNNAVERGIRPLGIGRKNWMFAGSERGGRTAAVFMSLFGSCRELNLNPWLYMKDILDRIMTHPSDRLRELLPGYWQPLERNTRLGVPVHLDADSTPPVSQPR